MRARDLKLATDAQMIFQFSFRVMGLYEDTRINEFCYTLNFQ